MINGKNNYFIKKFKTKKNHYVYDVNSNELIRVNHIIYEIIDKIDKNNIDLIQKEYKHKFNAEEILKSYKEIKKIKKEKNFFSDLRPNISSGFKSEKDFELLLSTGLNQIILQVTKRCNQKCKYCSTSGKYAENTSDREEDMSPVIVKKAIETFINSSNEPNRDNLPAITFYGGEPLLRFDLIKYSIDLAKKHGVFDKYKYSLTTNGTLLTKEVVEYLDKNNISILLSLDGPKDIHDRFRVFDNNKGTFDTIINNLKFIKKEYRDYFLKNMSINAVITPPYNFDCIRDFFYKRKLFYPINEKTRVDLVDVSDTTFIKDFNLEREKKNLNREISKLLKRYKRALINDEYNNLTIEKQFFLEDFYNIAYREISILEHCFPPIGACIPGKRRLFVRTEGNLYICERVNDSYEIGNIFNGFNLKRIYDLYIKYDNFYDDCKDCWALRLCRKCFVSVMKKEGFNRERKKELCERRLKNIEKNLMTYCEIIEKNPEAFNIYKDLKFL